MSDNPPEFFQHGGRRLAFRMRSGTRPTILFLPGYASDMDGAKATALDGFAGRSGRALLRFDYSGTGSSEGRFAHGTLERWLDESLAMVDHRTAGPLVVVGSSMGGWIALHLALRRPERVQALVGIAAAPDFTNWGFTAAQKQELVELGQIVRTDPNGGEPQLTTRGFWESGERLRLLDSPIALDCPVRLVHGERDEDVPVAVAMRLMDQLRSADVQLNILKGGGHRLSGPNEIETIVRTLAALVEPAP